MELILENVTKQYEGKTVLGGLSLTMPPGLYGLLGANGAGKTTLMRLICGILRPTSGQICLRTDGRPEAEEILSLGEHYRALLGYLPQDFGYYPGFTAMDFLMYMAALKGMEKRYARDRSEELLRSAGLFEVRRKKIRTFSGGMRQRLGIAQALLNDPKILVLDEPTAGLDPGERVRFRRLLRSLSDSRIIILSTHIVTDVQEADEILLLKEGRIVCAVKPSVHGTEGFSSIEGLYMHYFGGEGE